MSENTLKKHVLFVCTGNVCRSSMAEGIFKFLARHRNEFTCESAGVAAFSGFPASPNAVMVAKKYGVDISNHLSKPVTEELLKKSDYVIVMTVEHMHVLQSEFPEYAKKVYLLKELGESGSTPYDVDIGDPIGGDENTYKKCFHEIEQAIKGVLEKI